MNPDPASLDRLHDLVAPPPVPWWPPAPGWYWAGGVLLVLIVWLAIRGVVRWQHNRYRREAMAEWRRQQSRLASAETRVAALTELASLLKRTALTAFERSEVAPLTGDAWRTFLNRAGAMTSFNEPAGKLLEQAAYGTVDAARLDEPQSRRAADLVRDWILRHRAGGGRC